MKLVWIQVWLTPAGSFLMHYNSSVTTVISGKLHSITCLKIAKGAGEMVLWLREIHRNS